MAVIGNPEADRVAYFVALAKAIDDAGLSPGFARVSHECAAGFEITLTISQTIVDNFIAPNPETPAQPLRVA